MPAKIAIELPPSGIQTLLDKTAKIHPKQDVITAVILKINGQEKVLSGEEFKLIETDYNYTDLFGPFTFSRSEWNKVLNSSVRQSLIKHSRTYLREMGEVKRLGD